MVQTAVGYSGGRIINPTYEQVCSHTTGHAEVVKVEFDPRAVSYATLVHHFFRLHDPTQLNRQGPDIGDQYRSVIFYSDQEQQTVAESVRDVLQAKYRQPIVTQIVPAQPFYEAEAYHQKYAERTGRGMCHIPYTAL